LEGNNARRKNLLSKGAGGGILNLMFNEYEKKLLELREKAKKLA